MPPKAPASNPWEPVILIIGLLFVLLALLWSRGGLQNISSQGFFVSPASIPTSTTQTAPQGNDTDTNATTNNSY